MDGALDLRPEGRAAWLADASRRDPAAAAVAQALLNAAERTGCLDAPAAHIAAPVIRALGVDGDVTTTNGRIGAYRVITELGRGGMGAVYLGERADGVFEQRVALKVLPPWSARDQRHVRRFLEERRILATLDHPAIARIFDGGVTPDGRPWFAMELVDGAPIDRFCDDHRLAEAQRLDLFCRVCAAVQYAHRHLVVHRDLKTANILVSTTGDVKLLDFGIAKLLADDGTDAPASLTLTGELLLTPITASPEQLRGEHVTTASDVYSLGVLLHKLLTGEYPYRVASREPHAIAHAVLHQEPARRLRGELDVIVATAMRKNPDNRYGSAAELAGDVTRYLAGLPLQARPEGRWSRARKFVRRHRVAVAAGTGIALLVIAFAGVATLQAVRIRGQAQRIALERDRAERVSDFLGRLFRASDPYSAAAMGLSARDLLDSGSVLVDRELASQPEERARLQLVMGRAYLGLGFRDRARRLLEVSVAIRRRALPGGRAELAESLDALGRALFELGALADAERAHREALDAHRGAPNPDRTQVARTLNGLAAVLRAQGRFAAADSVSREAVALDESRSGASPFHLAESLHGLAEARAELGQRDAVALHRRALALRRQGPAVAQAEVLRAMIDLAGALDTAHDAEADSLFRDGLSRGRALLGADHPDLALGETRYAAVLRRRGRAAEAAQLYSHGLRVADGLPRVHPVRASALLGLGGLLQDRGEQARAEALYRQALAIRQTLLPPDHPHIAEAQHRLGLAILAQRRFMEAERYLLLAHQGFRRAFGDGDTRTRNALADLSALYVSTGRPREGTAYRARLADGSLSEDAEQPMPRSSGSVAVLPLDVPAGDVALADLGDVARSLLARAMNDDSLAAAGHVRLTLRADLRGDSRRLLIHASAVQRARGQDRVRARVEGPPDSLPYLVERLAVRLLALEAARDDAELDAFDRTTLPALKAYLAGAESMRRGQLATESARFFERASSLDSGFIPPRLGLAAIGELVGARGMDEQWKFDAAWARRHEMGQADRAILVTHLGAHYPLPPSLAERITAAREAATLAPHRVESWFMLGENLWRFGSLADVPEWQSEAKEALLRALAIEPTHATTLDRLVLLATLAGDRAALERHASQYLAHNAESESAGFIAWLRAAVLDDSAALAAIRRGLAAMPAMSLQRIGMFSQEFGIGVEDGTAAIATLGQQAIGSARRNLALNRSVRVFLNAGQPDSARRLLSETEGTFGPQQGVTKDEFRIFAALYWDGDRGDADAAAERIQQSLSRPPAPSASSACALAHWRLAQSRVRDADRALRHVRTAMRVSAPEPRLALPVCLASAAALREAGAGTPSSATLERLDSLLRNASSARDMVYVVGNVVTARLFAGRGEVTRALRIARRRAWWNAFLSTQLLQEARIAATVGDREGAARAYRHFLALRPAAEPQLREQVALAQRELQRLDRELSGPGRR